MNVLLPQPDGPMIAVTRFLLTSIETPLRAAFEPYSASISWISNTVSSRSRGGSG